MSLLRFLWHEQKCKWEEKHFAYILDRVLEEDWEEGLSAIFTSPTSHIIFRALNAEDKDNFLNQKVLDKIQSGSEQWANNISPAKITDRVVE